MLLQQSETKTEKNMPPLITRQLEFLYRLTAMTEYLNHQQLSKRIPVCGKSITPQTIQNWFVDFKKHNFNYFQSIIFEKVGLQTKFVFTEKRSPPSPYLDQVYKLCKPGTLHSCYLEQYLVPEGKKAKGFTTFSGFTMYPPFHATLADRPVHDFSQIDAKGFTHRMQLFKEFLRKLPVKQEKNHLQEHPLLVPMIFESRRGKVSSVHIWKAMLQTFGNDIWKYFPKSEQKETVAVKKIQTSFRLLNTSLNDLVQQIEIEYPPIVSSTIPVVMLISYTDAKDLARSVEKLAQRSAKLTVHPNKDKAIIISHMQSEGIQQLMEDELHINIKELFFQEKQEVKNSFDYEVCFDPEKGEWK